MISVRRIAHIECETPDLARQVAYYTEVMGLTLVDKGKDAAYLASTIDHHSVILRPGAEARCTTIAFQVAPDAYLAEFKRQVESHGIKVESRKDVEPTIPEMLVFEDTKGTVMEVFRDRETTPQRFNETGIVPLKLGHVAFNTVDVKKACAFYCDVLGFRVSDWMADFFVFLRCGPDHHTINLIDSKRSKLHHIAFELRNWGHIQTACDFLARKRYPLIWGPGRHGIGHNLFAYHRNPDGQIIETFAEPDQMNDESLGYFEPRPWHKDSPQKPKVWDKDPSASNIWGIMPPADFLD